MDVNNNQLQDVMDPDVSSTFIDSDLLTRTNFVCQQSDGELDIIQASSPCVLSSRSLDSTSDNAISMLSSSAVVSTTSIGTETPKKKKKKFKFRKISCPSTSQHTSTSTITISNSAIPRTSVLNSIPSTPTSTITRPMELNNSSGGGTRPLPFQPRQTESPDPTFVFWEAPARPTSPIRQHQQQINTPTSTRKDLKGINRRMYLVTYSQADTIRFPTRKSFADFVVAAFNKSYAKTKKTNPTRVIQWSVALEKHQDGGDHYHVALRLSDPKKFYGPWKAMFENGVVVDVSDKHDYYISMFRYICKDDIGFVTSGNHPDLEHVGSPRTKQCNAANRKRRSSEGKTGSRRSTESKKSEEKENQVSYKRSWNNKLANIDVADFVIKKNISTKVELYAEANKRKEEGECDLAIFLFSKSDKIIAELIQKAWLMKNAQKILSESSKTRMERLEDAYNGECVINGCKWIECALEVLMLNKIEVKVFASSMLDAMRFGRQKFRNVLLVGRSNTAKTFLLKPLKVIFKERLFENPAKDKYCWTGVENAQVICLQDFRYNSDIISWSDFLLLLEGETVKLPTPKNHCAEDIVLDSANDIPIFATSKSKIEFSRFSSDWEAETEMMDSRWNIIKLSHVFTKDKQKDILPCGRCFVDLITRR